MTETILSEAVRRRGRWMLLAATFLMWGGFFMVVPLLAIHFVDGLGWAAASIGLILAVRQFVQQGTTPLSGMLADRVGARGLICGGLVVRAVGFALMAQATTFSWLMFSAIIAALGGGMFESPRSAAVAVLTDDHNRARYYALTGMVGGMGVAVGTQVGSWLLETDFRLVAYTSAACYVVTFVLALVFLPRVRVAAAGAPLTKGVRQALHDRPFMLFTLLLMGFWFLWVQLSIAVPLQAKDLSGTAKAVGWVYGINSLLVVVVQYPLLRVMERWLAPLPMLISGVTVMALGLGGIALAHSTAALLGCVAVFSLGTLLASPAQQTLVAALARPEARGSYFGISSLSLAFGGAAGNWCGGWFYDLGQRWEMPAFPWLAFGVVGLATAAGLLLAGHQRMMTVEAPG